MTEFPLTGGCNCGAVRFEVAAPIPSASYCHCARCQRRTGAAASANAHPAEGTFRIVAGEDRLRVWKPDRGGEKWFCGDCGSSLFGRNLAHPDPIGIRMGAFDGDPGIRPSVRQFVRYAALAKARVKRVWLECEGCLASLLDRCLGVDRVFIRGMDPPPYDVHLPLMSCPRVFDENTASRRSFSSSRLSRPAA